MSRLPRYFFFVEGPGFRAEDVDGEELPDDAAAHRAAQQTARELKGGSWDSGVVVVRAADGRVVSEVPICGGKLH